MADTRSKLKLLAVVAALFTIFTVIGYTAIKTSNYMDVSQVLRLNHEVKVTVKGRLASVELDPQHNILILVLEGVNGEKLLALADVRMVEERYGPIQYLKWNPDNIVVQGVYNPATQTLTVTNILEGCHSTYKQPVTRA